MSRFRDHFAAIAALLVFTAAFFWKILLTNLILVGLDVFTYFYPYREYAVRAMRQGRIPYWNPYLFMGAPFLANIQAAVLYPPNWLVSWLPVPRQVSALIVLHVVLAGAFTYLFARRSLSFPVFAAWVAACTFALGGFLGAQVEHVNQLSVTAWLPLLLYLIDACWLASDGSRLRLVPVLAGGVVVALQVFAGHTQALYIALFGAGLYAILGGVLAEGGVPLRAVARRVAAAALMAVLGVLLSAVQLLPTLELSRLSYRSGGLSYREAASFSLRPPQLLQSLLPPYWLDLSQVFGESFSEYVAFVGVSGLMLALLGWLLGRDRRRHLFGLLALAGLFLAFGLFNPIYYLLYRLVPGFGLFRAPVRWLLLYHLGLSILIGYGLQAIAEAGMADRLRARWRSLRAAAGLWRVAPVALGVAAALVCAAALYVLDLPAAPAIAIWAAVALGSAALLLAAIGCQVPGRLAESLLAALLLAELFAGSRGLAYNNPTAPQAYDSLRSAPAHLLTDPGLHRFISMSSTVFDPGDLQDIRAIYGPQLDDHAVYEYIVSAKRNEILAFNIPMRFGLSVVDGYDGGLLPLKRFIDVQRLFLPEEELSADGRLREQLLDVPESRLLSLLNVKYIITDKVYDIWIDDVYYDLQFTARLGLEPSLTTSSPTQWETGQGVRAEIAAHDLPRYQATGLGVVSYLAGSRDLRDGTPVAEVLVTDTMGATERLVLRAGQDTAEGEYAAAPVAHARARAGHEWRDNPAGNDYVATFPFSRPRTLSALRVRALLPSGEFLLRGVSLIDARTGTNRTVHLSTIGRYRLVHSGDVKIYENLDNLPRALVVGHARAVSSDEEALAAMRAPEFRADRVVILHDAADVAEPGGDTGPARTGRADVLVYEPERVVVRTESVGDAYLVLADTWYPGWAAMIDGRSAPIMRANLVFRAVALPPGVHEVEFRYDARVVKLGAVVSGATLIGMLIVILLAMWIARKGGGTGNRRGSAA